MSRRLLKPLTGLLLLGCILFAGAHSTHAGVHLASMAPKILYFGPQSGKKAVFVTNLTSRPLHVTAEVSGPFQLLLSPSLTVNPGAVGTFGVELAKPVPTKSVKGLLAVVDDLGITQGSVKLQFDETPAKANAFLISESMLNFGTVPQGESNSLTFVGINNGDADIAGIHASAPSGFSIAGPTTIATENAALYTVVYRPVSIGKKEGGSIVLTAGNRLLGKVQVSGMGSAPTGGADLSGDWELESQTDPSHHTYLFTFTRDAHDPTHYTANYTGSDQSFQTVESLDGHFTNNTYAGSFGIIRTGANDHSVTGLGFFSVTLQTYHPGDANDYMVGTFTPDAVSGTPPVVNGACQLSRPHR